jgi:hypothetical protein
LLAYGSVIVDRAGTRSRQQWQAKQ